MRDFTSFAEFAVKLAELQSAEALALHHGLKRVAELVEKTAKSEIGHYNDAAGPFPAWAELAPSTESRKAKMGYPADAPLLATGEMRDSIQHQVGGLEAEIGSNDDKMVYHEFGTSKMPARPVLGPAAFRNKRKIEQIIGHAAVTGLLEGTGIHPSLGYDFEV
jgi:HK97 gp10 family phage protein